MKRLLHLSFASSLVFAFLFGVGVSTTVKTNSPTKVEASSSSYWDSWISSNSAILSTGGTTLVKALKSKITQVSDGSTNTISYNGLWSSYKTSDAVPGSNGAYIWDMYGGFQFSYQSGGSSYKNEGDCYNREHSVPKSWFGEKTPAYSDIIHLVPTDGKVNGMRSNYAFGEVSNATYSYSFPARSYNGVQYQKAGISKLGSPKAINGFTTSESKVFEPDDQYKGDFARIYMYFAVRYGGGTCQATTGSGTAIFTSTCTNANPYVTNYGLALLQKWHVQDPVSDKEINRNNAIETLQGNRNPFVDYPEWADKIFGTNYGEGGSSSSPSVSISQTTAFLKVGETISLTASASDSSLITWSTSNKNIATVNDNGVITGIAEGSATITASALIEGETYTAICSVDVVSSSTTDDGTYTMLTSISNIDESAKYVLGVDGVGFHYSGNSSWGKVALPTDQTPLYYTLKKETGNTTFTAQTVISNKTYYLTIPTSNTFTMSETSSSIKLGTTTTDSEGQPNYAVTNSSNTSRHLRINGSSGLRSYAGTTGTMAYFYKVGSSSSASLSSISVSGYKTTFLEGDSFSFGGIVTAHYSDDSSIDVTSFASFSGYDMTSIGTQTITVTYGEKTATYTISINQGTLSSISVSGQKTTYLKNSTFSFDGVCLATFANGYQKQVIPTSVSSPDMSTSGTKTVSVSYSYNGVNKTTTYEIIVSSHRVVLEESYNVIGTITYSNNKQTISNDTLSISTSGYTTIENNAIRLGSGSNTGTLTITSHSSNINKIVVRAKSYTNDTDVILVIGGTNNNISSNYTDYSKTYDVATNTVTIETTTKKKRAYIESITLYSFSSVDIGTSDDCVGLEAFITNYMHMDYVDNLGWCKDEEHHYYSIAKEAFNSLNAHQRSLFVTNSAYSSEWKRLSTWATFNGDILNSSQIFVSKSISNSEGLFENNLSSVIIIFSLLCLSTSIGCILIKRKKTD